MQHYVSLIFVSLSYLFFSPLLVSSSNSVCSSSAGGVTSLSCLALTGLSAMFDVKLAHVTHNKYLPEEKKSNS